MASGVGPIKSQNRGWSALAAAIVPENRRVNVKLKELMSDSFADRSVFRDRQGLCIGGSTLATATVDRSPFSADRQLRPPLFRPGSGRAGRRIPGSIVASLVEFPYAHWCMGGSCPHRFSFIQSFDERGRLIWTLAEKNFELCEKGGPGTSG